MQSTEKKIKKQKEEKLKLSIRFVATHSIISDSLGAENALSSENCKRVKEEDLYSAFIEVPYTQGAQVRITQCYLQTTPYLPLPLPLVTALQFFLQCFDSGTIR